MVSMIRAETVLESWKTVRQDTAQAVEDFPEEELDFSPADGLMSFRAITTHIIEAGNSLTGVLLDGMTDLSGGKFSQVRGKYAPELSEKPGKAELTAKLRSTIEEHCSRLAAQPPEFFSGIITRFDGQQATRLEMIQFIKEHELTHRSQLFVYLRLKGIVPVTTRRRLAQTASRR